MRPMISSIIVAGMLLFTGCGYKEGVVTGDSKAFLYFTGQTKNVTVTIDDGTTFPVLPGRDHQYTITPGKHTVRVMKNGILIVERNIYVGDGVAKEIHIQ